MFCSFYKGIKINDSQKNSVANTQTAGGESRLIIQIALAKYILSTVCKHKKNQ